MVMGYTSLYFCLWILGVLKLTQQQKSNTVRKRSSPTVNGVSGLYTDETETISVLKGDSVTLNSDVTEIHRDDQILWTFRLHSSETRIAEIYKQIISVYGDKENNERFRERLQIDEQTGSLTITNINKSHSGLYKLQTINGGVKHKSFSVAVYGLLPGPVIISDSPQNPSVSERSSKQNCSLVCSAVNVSHVTLSWFKGNSLMSSISVSDLSIRLSLPLEIQCLDDSYSCVVSYSFTNRTTHLNNTDICHPCPVVNHRSSFMMAIPVILALLVVIAVVGGLMYHRTCKKPGQKDNTHDEEMHYADPTFSTHPLQSTDVIAEDHTVYSTIKT